MHRRILPSLAALTLAALLGGCKELITFSNSTDADSKFAGCYDRSCVDAPVLVPGVPAFTSLTTMTSHTCGLTAAGEAWCWGDNALGQLGDGTDAPRSAPVKVAGGRTFTSLAAGGGFTCGLATDWTVYCWGSDATAQLGQPAPEKCLNNQVACSRLPLALAGRSYAALGAGMRHACAVDTSGATWCWGFNFLGEVGSPTLGTTIPSPVRVPGATVFTSIAAGDAYTCGLTAAGRAYCWGSNNRGELGRPVGQCNSVAGFSNYCASEPGPVNTASTFTSLSASAGHSCGVTSVGSARCWGDNGQGQLGAGSFDYRSAPVAAQGGMAFSAVSASSGTTCATPASGASVCWGLNLFGKLGVGSRIDLTVTPLTIAGGRKFASFAGAMYHVCALTAEGAAYCWGSGRQGQLGTGVLLP